MRVCAYIIVASPHNLSSSGCFDTLLSLYRSMSTQKRGYLSFCKGALKKTLSRGWTLCYGVMICINVCVGMHSHLFLECVYSQQVSIPNAQVCFEVPWSWDELCYSRLMSGFLRLVGAAVSWEHTLLHQPDQTDPPPGLTHTHTHTHTKTKKIGLLLVTGQWNKIGFWKGIILTRNTTLLMVFVTDDTR